MIWDLRLAFEVGWFSGIEFLVCGVGVDFGKLVLELI